MTQVLRGQYCLSFTCAHKPNLWSRFRWNQFPVENAPPHPVPAHPVGKADGVGGGEELLGHEQLRRLAVVAADLIHPQRNRLVLVGVLALDHQHRDAVDEKDDILPRTVTAVVKGPLFGDFVNVARRVLVIDQDQVALALFLMVEELAPIAQVLDEFRLP